MERLGDILDRSAWPLLRRDGLNNKAALAGARGLRLALSDGGLDERAHSWVAKNLGARQTNVAILLAATQEKTVGIWHRHSVVEGEGYAARGRGNGDDAVRWPQRARVADHEEVVVVVDELVCCGQEFAEPLTTISDELCQVRLELLDERGELALWLRSRAGLGSLARHHGRC